MLVAVLGLVLSLGGFGSTSASGSVRIAVSAQMERELILSAHNWLGDEGLKVTIENISIVSGAVGNASAAGPLAAFVAEDHRDYGSACLALHTRVRLSLARGDEYPSPLSRWPLCVLFSKAPPDRSWKVAGTASSNCGAVGDELRKLWGQRIPVCRTGPTLYQL